MSAPKQPSGDTTQRESLESALQAYLAAPPFWLRFPPDIERNFETRGYPGRLKRFQFSLRAALLLWMALMGCDALLSPGNWTQTLPLRIATLLLTAGVGLWLMPRNAMAAHREWIVTSLIGVMAATQVGCVAMLPDAAALLYEGVLLLPLLLCNQVARVRFRFALPFTALWVLLYLVQELILRNNRLDGLLLEMVIASLVAAMSLSAKRAMELDNRATHALKRLNQIGADKLESANQELNALARFDPLTNLPNRRSLNEYLERMLRNAQRTGAPLSLIFIDVDFFKRYNDHYGHAAGDDCLCFVSSLIRFAARRPLDMAARFGGEEFVVLLPDTALADARRVAEEIRRLIDDAVNPHAGAPLGHLTVSIGVAGGPCLPAHSMELLLETADHALYQAKSAGRNRVEQAEIGASIRAAQASA